VFLLCHECFGDERTAGRTRFDGETLYIKDGDGLDGYEVRGPYGRNADLELLPDAEVAS
jgi:hypothetical protein